MNMKDQKKLEEAIYDFGYVSYKLGRYETDGKDTTKEYNKFFKQKEDLTNFFDEYFGSSKKSIKKDGERLND
jgi:hypothetical protein